MTLTDQVLQDFKKGEVITTTDLLMMYYKQFEDNYLKVFLSNSEVDANHSHHYRKIVKRVGRGRYILSYLAMA